MPSLLVPILGIAARLAASRSIFGALQILRLVANCFFIPNPYQRFDRRVTVRPLSANQPLPQSDTAQCLACPNISRGFAATAQRQRCAIRQGHAARGFANTGSVGGEDHWPLPDAPKAAGKTRKSGAAAGSSCPPQPLPAQGGPRQRREGADQPVEPAGHRPAAAVLASANQAQDFPADVFKARGK